MDAQHAAIPGVGTRRDDHGEYEERNLLIVDAHGHGEGVELAFEFPIGRPIMDGPGRAGEQQHDDRDERRAGRDEVDEKRTHRLRAPLPQTVQLEREQADTVEAGREQMAEEERNDEQGRDREPYTQFAFAERDPGDHRPQRKTDAEHVVHDADEEDAVVEKRNRDERQDGPAPEQDAMQREHAGDDHCERQDREHLAREIDVHETIERRHDEIDHQVRNDLPLDLIEFREIGIGLNRVHHVGAREMVDVVRQRRQRVRENRDRRDGQQQHGQNRDG